tara:strand:- start:342 stop:596 length:255 start_codon:yes stop_codon:yes gene_type:complete
MEARIRKKLTEAFSPVSFLEVINESHKHKGHSGSPETGESHFKISLKAPAFKGLSRVAAHQLIYKMLEAEFKAGLHALSIRILT